ncbi:MAG: tryptophan halogenase [Sphingomonas bacterium]|nr:tryptophan halogenase [Sphingomonas bacterium]
MSGAPNRIVVVGRDAALWLAAAALRRALGGAGLEVAAVELPARLHPGRVHASLPPLEALHNRLGLDEATLLRATQGGYALGWNLVPPAPAAPFFLAHGSYGAPIDGNPFFPYWLKARGLGMNAAFEDFSPTAMAARHGRVLLPDAETEAFGRTDYGYHLPALAYAGLLKSLAQRAGVTLHQARDVLVERDGEQGTIRAVIADAGQRIEGDVFVDASGSDAVLMGAAQPFAPWADEQATDRLLVAHAPRFASVPVYGEIRIARDGWLALHATRAGTQIGFAFNARDLSDADALAAAGALAKLPLGDVTIETLATGRRETPWAGNCIAIGAAAYRLDALFDLDLHVAQLGIVHLLSLFPASGGFAAECDEYNRILGSTLARLHDASAALYALNRFDGPFWQAARALPVTEAVAHKITAFQARGEIAPMEDESFAPDWWQALFAGLGAAPRSWPPVIDATSPEHIKDEFRRILGVVKRKVLEQPAHDAYLQLQGGGA